MASRRVKTLGPFLRGQGEGERGDNGRGRQGDLYPYLTLPQVPKPAGGFQSFWFGSEASAPSAHVVARRTQCCQVPFDGAPAHTQCRRQIGHGGGSALFGSLAQQAQQLVMTAGNLARDSLVFRRGNGPGAGNVFVVSQGAAGGGLGTREAVERVCRPIPV